MAPRENRSVRPVGLKFALLMVAALSVWLAATGFSTRAVSGTTDAKVPAAHIDAVTCPTQAGGPVEDAVGIAEVSVGGCPGYWVASASGQVSAFGSAQLYGSMAGVDLSAPVLGIFATPSGDGYYQLGADGGVFSFGDAQFYGSTGGMRLNAPVVSMALAPNDQGYWLVAKDGGVFSFGAVNFYGSMGGKPLNKPVAGIAVAPAGEGYWLVAQDGGVFTFGRQGFYGSMGGKPLDAPVVGMAAAPDGGGYWLVASDGGIFNFGDAAFQGSMGDVKLNEPVVAMSSTPDGGGYSLVDQYGHVYSFGDAPYLGGAACPENSLATYQTDPNLMVDTGGGSQLFTVVGAYFGDVNATVTAWSRQADGCWSPANGPWTGEVGLAADGSGGDLTNDRVSGDYMTPTGIYGFGDTMYGVSPNAPNDDGYQYVQLTCGSWWDEQPGTAQYNEFVQLPCGVTPSWAADSEALWTEPQPYPHFAVIEYNAPPTYPEGDGGAGIFFHLDTTVGYTEGCVANPLADLNWALAWMSPADNPHIVIGVPSEMDGF
jgi:L,D-peptidoglycan transpeptidase YkuD (ErfK/YbiS/YcfS/YnhG family)